jgi:hypothetical protein
MGLRPAVQQFDFEESIHSYFGESCKIFTFDHTVAKPQPPAFVTYHSYGLAPQDVSANLKSLRTLYTVANVSHVDILKIDIEGAEYGALIPALEDGTFAHPRMILIEVSRAYRLGAPPPPHANQHMQTHTHTTQSHTHTTHSHAHAHTHTHTHTAAAR